MIARNCPDTTLLRDISSYTRGQPDVTDQEVMRNTHKLINTEAVECMSQAVFLCS